MSNRTLSLTLFFPCYNDRETISSLIEQADKVASEWTNNYEILAVDDGSTDGSRELLKHLQSNNKRLRLIFHERNLGYGAALQSGFQEARKELIFYTDGDGQYDVSELTQLLPLMTNDVDIVNGYKIKRGDPWHRQFLGGLYLLLSKMLFRIAIRDVNCDFRLTRRRVFNTIQLKSKSGAIGAELIWKAEREGFKIVECPVHHYRRPSGHSQFLKVEKMIQTIFELIRLRLE